MFCTQCGAALQASHRFCARCGVPAEAAAIVPVKTGALSRFFSVRSQEKQPPRRSFVQKFGLDPRVAFLVLIVDMMLNAGDVLSMGLLLPLSIAAGFLVGYIAYRAQIHWYGDDPESARIKAVMLGLLTAIPTPLPEALYVPAGILGLVRTLRSTRRPAAGPSGT